MANNKPIGVAYADPQLDSFQVGAANEPIEITSAGVLNGAYATTSAPSGDTRLNFNRLTFTSTGSGETARFLTRVTGAGAATAGTINGAHISTSVNTGGTISMSRTGMPSVMQMAKSRSASTASQIASAAPAGGT